MADNEPQQRKAVNLRLPDDLYARLVAFGAKTERSTNGAAVFAIRTFLDQQDQQADPTSLDPTHLR